MGFKPWRVFLDTSALLAGLLSTKGAARQILACGEIRLIELLVSADVLIEADRNIGRKFPLLLDDYRLFIRDTHPTLVEDPSRHDIEQAIPWVGRNDAPILAAALKTKADYLVTWNTRDFMTPRVPKTLNIKIRNPGAFLDEWNTHFKEWSI